MSLLWGCTSSGLLSHWVCRSALTAVCSWIKSIHLLEQILTLNQVQIRDLSSLSHMWSKNGMWASRNYENSYFLYGELLTLPLWFFPLEQQVQCYWSDRGCPKIHVLILPPLCKALQDLVGYVCYMCLCMPGEGCMSNCPSCVQRKSFLEK